MKFIFRYVLCAILLAELPSAAMHFAAQEAQPTSQLSQSSWMGEWGSFHPAPEHLGQTPESFFAYSGRSLSITDCAGQQCKVSINVRTQSGHCEALGDIQVESERAATMNLHQFTFKCSLYLEKKEGKEITAKSGQENCSAFCTPGAAFIGSYPLKSQSTFSATMAQRIMPEREPRKQLYAAVRSLQGRKLNGEHLFGKQWTLHRA